MAAVKFEANFVSAVAHIIDPTSTTTNAAAGAAFTRQIEALISRAQAAYAKQSYRDAVSLYKEARSELFRLLDPSHASVRHILDDGFQLPISSAIESKILEAGLKLAEVTQPTAEPDLPPVGVTATPIPNAARRFDRIGYALDSGVPPAARTEVALGLDLLDRGFAEQSASVLADALQSVGQPATPDGRAFAASVALNLSSAQVLAGQPDQAQAAATQAQTFFANLNDRPGQAQALHNQAVALKQAGKEQEAQATFARASDLAKTLAAPVAPAAPAAVALAPAPVATASARFALGGSILHPAPSPKLRSVNDLSFITAKDAATLSIRAPGAAADAGHAAITVPLAAAKPTWSWLVPSGDAVVEVAWKNGVRPAPQTLVDTIYRTRVTAGSLANLQLILAGTGETNAYLTHIYAFVIPQALGDCYSQLGQYALAETYYLQAVAYTYINQALEVPALWIRLADNILRWGDSLYRAERIDDCQAIYAKLVTNAGAPGASPIYTLATFAAPAADAKKLLANLAKPQNAGVNPSLARPILLVWARWQYLLAGLDFFGTTFTPILTFEYLQQAASDLAQRAVQAEREYVDFQSRSEAAAATRRELQSAAAMADAAVGVQNEQYQASISDTNAAQAAVDLANLRASDGAKDRDTYRTDGYWQYVSASIAAAHAAHADWHEDEIRQLAANMEAGSWKGDYGKLSAAATLLGGQKSYEYQLGRLDDAVNEMNAAKPITQAQAASAAHRQELARLQYEAAVTHAALADDALTAFDNNVFTPEVWARMAGVMRNLSADYLDWAIRVAKLMERAYNFENDDTAQVIRSQYPGVKDADNLFGGDFLLRDIQSFTYRFIANQRAKQSQIKDLISLANLYPFDFYRFQQTGRMAFETSLHDADLRHPGFYEQRIAGVEVEIIGLLPPDGLHGSLRAGGLSRYRSADGGQRTRIHTVDTLALSEFTMRNDAFVFRVDPRIHGLFEGHGVGTTWVLDVPRRSNNIDYRLITDVRLVLYYGAYYDSGLHDRILAAAPKPGELVHVRSLLLQFDFPEVWYTLLDTGSATFTVTPDYLPRNETNFRTQTASLVLATADGVSPANVAITLTPPGKAAAKMITDANGQIAAQAGNPLAAQLGGPVLGDWQIALQPPAGSPLLGADGKLAGDKLAQISLLLQYQFDWPA